MDTSQPTLSPRLLLELFSPQLIKSWFQQAEKSSKTRRFRRLTPVVLFLGMLLYAAKGLKNMQHAFSDALASVHPDVPPVAVSKGSLTPARRRLPLEVLHKAYQQVLFLAQQCPSRELVPGFRILCFDGSTFSVADTPENEHAFGRPKASRGKAGYPRLRTVFVMDAANHLFVDEAHGHYNNSSEKSLTNELMERNIKPGVLFEADRGFYNYRFACRILFLGGDFVLRVKQCIKTPVVRELPDGSYLSVLFSPKTSKNKKFQRKLMKKYSKLSTEELLSQAQQEKLALYGEKKELADSLLIRVIEYSLTGEEELPPVEPKNRPIKLISSVYESTQLSARQAADGYHLRWNEEVGIRELKWLCDTFGTPHFSGQTPESVEQEYVALLTTHSALRVTMMMAAEKEGCDPRRLSLSGAQAVVLRYVPRLAALEPKKQELWLETLLTEVGRHRLPRPQQRVCPRAVKIKMSNYPSKARCQMPPSVQAHREPLILAPSGASP